MQTPRALATLTLTFLLAAPVLAAGGDAAPESFQKAARPLADVGRVVMTSVSNDLLLAVYSADGPDGPTRFAEPLETYLTPTNSGTWEQLADGSRLWRLRIASAGAKSLNLAFSRFEVPKGARLWLYDPERKLVQGPYTREDRTEKGELWTALVLGEEIVLELDLPAGSGSADLVLRRVHHGFRFFEGRDGSTPEKQGSCQNDVVCPEANPYRNQVRAVGWYSVEGVGACTGTLMNNTARNGKPYFLSAEHCEVTAGNASTMVVYWNYESPSCGRLSGGSLKDNQSGAIYRASYRRSDFVLVELKKKPEAKWNLYYSGWNASPQAPKRAVGIHHPNLDEKAISFNNRQLTPDGATHWQIIWNDGTTEPGSSGSCIFDTQGLCVGTLTGGDSYCWDPRAPDYYGRFSVHWTGGGGQGNSLKPWLDPANTGRKSFAGMEPSAAGAGGGGGGTGGGGGGGTGGGGSCKADTTTACLVGGRFQVTATWKTAAGANRNAKVSYSAGKVVAFSFVDDSIWDLHASVATTCGQNGRQGLYAAASTDRGYTLRVKDTKTGQVKTYKNAAGKAARAVLDYRAFSCP